MPLICDILAKLLHELRVCRKFSPTHSVPNAVCVYTVTATQPSVLCPQFRRNVIYFTFPSEVNATFVASSRTIRKVYLRFQEAVSSTMYCYCLVESAVGRKKTTVYPYIVIVLSFSSLNLATFKRD